MNRLDIEDKRLLARLLRMIETHLIWHEHYIPWTYELIREMPVPPGWVLNLCTVKYVGDAARILGEAAFAPPFPTIDATTTEGELIACHWLRYRRREISWATFLRETGIALDSLSGPTDCSFMYVRLTELEHREFALRVEEEQSAEIAVKYADAIASVEKTYAFFLAKYRESLTCPRHQ